MPMNAALYKNLTKCDAKEGWYLVKDVVCAQLMGILFIIFYIDIVLLYEI